MDLNTCFDVVEHIVVDYLLQGTLSVIDSNGTMPILVFGAISNSRSLFLKTALSTNATSSLRKDIV